MQKAFIFDINKCTGCQACQIACSIENQVDPHMRWREVHTFNEDHYPGIPGFHLSLACNHCIDPPCMKHCPALAYTKDDVTGAVTVDPDLCIGCKYCTWACPFDAPQVNDVTGLIEKCTFCDHRLQEGLEPACVSLCPTGALQFGDFDETSQAHDVPGFPMTDVTPAIRFVPLRGGQAGPLATAATEIDSPADAIDANRRKARSKITLKSESSLIVFSLLATVLVAWLAAQPVTGALERLVFVGLGVIGAGLSTMHLGRKMRAPRSVLNWRHSWLSREVILYSSFLGLSALHLLVAPTQTTFRWVVVLCGFAALVAMDNVYRVTHTRRLWLHSAQVSLTGLFMWGVFSGNAMVFLPLGILKLVLYLHRRYTRSQLVPRSVSMIRIVLGLVIPVGLWGLDVTPVSLAVACVIIGDIIDRCEYYLDLDVPAPRTQIVLDLDEAIEERRLASG